MQNVTDELFGHTPPLPFNSSATQDWLTMCCLWNDNLRGMVLLFSGFWPAGLGSLSLAISKLVIEPRAERSMQLSSLFSFGAALVGSLLIQINSASAQSTAFTYQGRLNDGAGPASGSYD